MCSSCLSEPSVAASLVAEFLGSLARLPEQDITEIMTVVYYFGVSPHLRFTCQWDWDLGRVRGVCEKPLCTEFAPTVVVHNHVDIYEPLTRVLVQRAPGAISLVILSLTAK